ncbi:MAG: hypothetical protein [Wendovervirus sonii]|uniref:Uncharacterized protein n=1 Tax=phage Lak_Megaphage_Sonny TaxID=3109229 RepID=A0ABZ0Z2U9_9CAUD|nr:MAG: hypothetical protein [phage Lak_Megaphage_Sonny]
MTKKQLYESIMRHVSYEVKKALNESFDFEPAEAMNAIVAAFNDERLSKVVANIQCSDIAELVKEMSKAANNELPAKAPLKISSLKTLADYILIKHFNEAAMKELTEMGKAELDDLANCVCQEVLNAENNANNDEEHSDIESKQQYNQQMNRNLPLPASNNLPECNCGNKKPVKECGTATNENYRPRIRRRSL